MGITIDNPTSADEKTIITDADGNIAVQYIQMMGKDPAKIKLNIMINAVTQALTDTSDDYSEAFSDANGLRNTVDTVNTTSTYDAGTAVYTNTGWLDDGDETTDNGSASGGGSNYNYTLTTASRGYISSISAFTADTDGTATWTIKDASANTLATKAVTLIQNNYTPVVFTIADYTRPVESGETLTVYVASAKTTQKTGAYTGTLFNVGTARNRGAIEYTHVALGSEAADLICDYGKGEPSEVYCVGYDENMDEIINNYTFELKHNGTSETTGELDPLTIVTGLTWTNSPDKLIIHQKATGDASIGYVCLIIKE